MRSRPLLVLLFFFFLAINHADAGGGRLFGTWQLREFMTISSDKRETPFCFGPSGALIYEEAGESMSVAINCNDGRSLFYSGSFKVHGSEIIHHIANASDPRLIGQELVRKVESLSENELVLTGPLEGSKSSIRISWTRKAPSAKPAQLALLSYIRVKPGAENAFRKEIAAIVEASRSEPGNIAWFVQEEKTDPTRFVFYTRWVDENALKYHLESPPLASYLKRTAPLLAEPAKLVKFDPVDEN